MEKLTGKNKINVAVFISGRGSNLYNLIQFSKKKSDHSCSSEPVIKTKDQIDNNHILSRRETHYVRR